MSKPEEMLERMATQAAILGAPMTVRIQAALQELVRGIQSRAEIGTIVLAITELEL